MESARNINPFGLRIPQELREKLETASRISGRSLNSEILQRLEHSFSEESTRDRLEAMEAALTEAGLLPKPKAKRR